MRRGAAVLAVLLGACAGPGKGSETPKVVLTTFQPLYSFAAKVAEGSDGVRVVNLAPRAEGPHDFDLDDSAHAARCRDLVRAAHAVVTLRSLALAESFDRLYPWCRKVNLRIVEIDPVVTWESTAPRMALIANPEDSLHGKGGTPPPNPHVWLSLSHAVRLVEALSRDLAALDPAGAERYRRNARRFQGELRKLKAEYEGKFSDVENLAVVSLTEGFPYLTADFAIDVADYILEPKDAAEVEARIRASGAKVVIAEETPGEDVLRAVQKAGGRVLVLTTIEEGWGEGAGLDPDGYLEAMRFNLKALAQAFGV